MKTGRILVINNDDPSQTAEYSFSEPARINSIEIVMMDINGEFQPAWRLHLRDNETATFPAIEWTISCLHDKTYEDIPVAITVNGSLTHLRWGSYFTVDGDEDRQYQYLGKQTCPDDIPPVYRVSPGFGQDLMYVGESWFRERSVTHISGDTQ